MLARHVALVSQTEQVAPRELMIAAAAIQKQITRDFGPIWQIHADVAAFEDRSDVPLDYWPIFICDRVPDGVHGIHLNHLNGEPFALVEVSENWTLAVSHECMEMLADPSGNRVQAGNSYIIPNDFEFLDGKDEFVREGRVGYLVEVCDPCESAEFGYSVNGVLVSDFYTPNFFDPVLVPGMRYSFTGEIKGPREILDGGYLSWIQPETKSLCQVFRTGKRLKFNSYPLAIPRPAKADAETNVPISLRRYADCRSEGDRRDAIGRNAISKPHKQLLLTERMAVRGDQPSEQLKQALDANADILQAAVQFALDGNDTPTG